MGFRQTQKARARKAVDVGKAKGYKDRFGKKKQVIGKHNKLHQKYGAEKVLIDPQSIATGMGVNAKTRKKLMIQKALQMKKAFKKMDVKDSDSWESCSEDDEESEEQKQEEKDVQM